MLNSAAGEIFGKNGPIAKFSWNGNPENGAAGEIFNTSIKKINRKFHVATEIGSTFFGC
jgi:hypothetical protein